MVVEPEKFSFSFQFWLRQMQKGKKIFLECNEKRAGPADSERVKYNLF